MARIRRTSIAYRLSFYVSAVALGAIALVVAGLLVYAYRQQVREIEDTADRLAALTVPQLTASVWDFAEDRTREQVDDLLGLEHLAWAELVTPEGTLRAGRAPAGGTVERVFVLEHPVGGPVGELRVTFSLAAARADALREAGTVAVLALVPLLAMAAATLLVFRGLVTRHLDALAGYARSLTVDTLDRSFAFRRRKHGPPDELDRLRDAFDAMRTNLRDEIRGRRAAEERLARAELHYRTIFNATADAMFIHDAASGRIVDVNDSVLAMYGCTRGEMLASGPEDFTAPSRHEQCTDAYARLADAAAGRPQVFEWRARRRDGGEFWVEVSLRSMAPADPGLVVAAVRDITARREAEQRLQHLQRMETVGQLAGGIAHDFNNLLSGILGAAEMIELEAVDQPSRDYAAMIIGTTRRAADLTSKLLSFARRGPVLVGSQDLHEIIDDVRTILERSIDKRIELVTATDAARHHVTGDRAQLQSAILNLGLNARDAMPDGGTLTIATANPGAEAGEPAGIEITVTDTGVGIPAELGTQIFEPFFTTKQAGKGTGLGLAAVEATVREHEGTIGFSSVPGRGTTFRIVLPVTEPDREAAPRAAPLVPGEGCVLVIDDEEAVRDMLARSLERLGYRALTAADGERGIAAYRERRGEIDLVILDMIMPRLSGPDTFAALRALDPDVRILVATGFADDDALEGLRRAGLQGTLRKPFQLTELSRQLALALGR